MKTFLLFIGVSVALASLTLARPAYKKELGLDNCKKCHTAEGGPKKPSDNAFYKAAKEHAAALKKGEGDYKGKTSCMDCHKGKLKPAK